MIREVTCRQIGGFDGVPVYLKNLFGISDDTKPVNAVSDPESIIATGSTFTEVNTGDVYYFDEESNDWACLMNLGGNSGSDSDSVPDSDQDSVPDSDQDQG